MNDNYFHLYNQLPPVSIAGWVLWKGIYFIFHYWLKKGQHKKEQKDSASSAWLEITFDEMETMKISQLIETHMFTGNLDWRGME